MSLSPDSHVREIRASQGNNVIRKRLRGFRPRRSSAGSKQSSPTDTPTKLLIVHASPALRLGLLAFLQAKGTCRICGQTEDAREARELVARHRPDALILGLTLQHGDGIGLVKDLRKSATGVRILILSNRMDALSVQRSFRAGAHGYLATHDALAEIPRALSQILSGDFYASPSVSRLLLRIVAIKAADSEGRLSDRELQVFRLIGRGLGPSRVAEELHLSVKTIETHRMRIKLKLGLRSGADLNRHAEQWLARKFAVNHLD